MCVRERAKNCLVSCELNARPVSCKGTGDSRFRCSSTVEATAKPGPELGSGIKGAAIYWFKQLLPGMFPLLLIKLALSSTLFLHKASPPIITRMRAIRAWRCCLPTQEVSQVCLRCLSQAATIESVAVFFSTVCRYSNTILP